MTGLRFTLIQCRNPDDPMLEQEVQCFYQALNLPDCQITPINLLASIPGQNLLTQTDGILVGGAGDYSVLGSHAFLLPFFEFLRNVCESAFPMFASCFGFHAMCVALGGSVITDIANAEIGTRFVYLTLEGRTDAVFGRLPSRFYAQVGHKDRADKLPDGVICLAFSEKAPVQAYKIADKPIYATQFHPELTMAQNRERFENYIYQYSAEETGLTAQSIRESYRQSRESYRLLPAFVEHIFGK